MDYTHLIPIDPAGLDKNRWWCAICGNWRHDESAVLSHLRTSCHEPEPERHVHYFTTEEFANLIRNTKSRAIQAADRFADHLDSLIGVDDFLTDAGWEFR